MRAMHDFQIAVDDMRFVVERVVIVEREELILDGNLRIVCGGNGREQVEGAAEFLVEDRAGQVVAARRTAGEKEPAAQLPVRFVDRDVLTGRVSVPDKICRRRQSAKPAANDMRLHLGLLARRVRQRRPSRKIGKIPTATVRGDP